jgi:hypothetical protein
VNLPDRRVLSKCSGASCPVKYEVYFTGNCPVKYEVYFIGVYAGKSERNFLYELNKAVKS